MSATATRPQHTWRCLLLPTLLSTGRLDEAGACFASDGCLVTPDATGVHGRARIRPVLAQLIARHPRIQVGPRNVLVAGEVAFAREHWTIRTDGPEGSRLEQTFAPALVMRQIEGKWLLVIAALWEPAK